MQCWVCLSGCLWIHHRQPDQMIRNQQQPTVCKMSHTMESNENCKIFLNHPSFVSIPSLSNTAIRATWMANKNPMLPFLGSLSNDNVRSHNNNNTTTRLAITWRWKLMTLWTGAPARHSEVILTARLGLPGLSSSIPCYPIRLPARWWSVDTSTPQ